MVEESVWHIGVLLDKKSYTEVLPAVIHLLKSGRSNSTSDQLWPKLLLVQRASFCV